MNSENSPFGWALVPLNIRCSRKWAMPDLPGGSSAAPFWYQIIWVTTGARWSGITTTLRPFSRVKSAIRVEAEEVEVIAIRELEKVAHDGREGSSVMTILRHIRRR